MQFIVGIAINAPQHGDAGNSFAPKFNFGDDGTVETIN